MNDISKNNLFYDLYDVVFAGKDYAGEVEAALRLGTSSSVSPQRILEVGCGTGNHTVQLLARGLSVTAVDIDEEMAARCRRKVAANFSASECVVLTSAIEDMSLAPFDLCLALFNVINYVPTREGLRQFFSAVRRLVRPQHRLVFDAWNGTAALNDPPQRKTRRVTVDDAEYTVDLSPATDIAAKRTRLVYEIVRHVAGQETARVSHSFDHTLWTPQEISADLASAGLTLSATYPGTDFSRQATAADWKLTFVAET